MNWKLIPDRLNYDVPLANNPIADQFHNEFTRIPAERFLANEIKAREFLDQGCQEVDNKIRELGWRKKGRMVDRNGQRPSPGGQSTQRTPGPRRRRQPAAARRYSVTVTLPRMVGWIRHRYS